MNATTPILLMALAIGSPAPTASPAAVRAQFHPQWDYEYTALVPQRPNDAAQVHLAVGLLETYEREKQPQEMDLQIRDPKTRLLRTYLLAANPTIDGEHLTCFTKATGVLCDRLPAEIIPGKTMVAVLYWSQDFPSCCSFLATDAIESLPSQP